MPLVLKGQIVISTEELQKKLAEAEQNTHSKKTKSHSEKSRIVVQHEGTDDEDMDDEFQREGRKIQDSIEVRRPQVWRS